jgi:hypothetical protein
MSDPAAFPEQDQEDDAEPAGEEGDISDKLQSLDIGEDDATVWSCVLIRRWQNLPTPKLSGKRFRPPNEQHLPRPWKTQIAPSRNSCCILLNLRK